MMRIAYIYDFLGFLKLILKSHYQKLISALDNHISLLFHLFRSGRVAKKRRRVASLAQRRAANIRERRRMFNLNEAFDRLRNKVHLVIHMQIGSFN